MLQVNFKAHVELLWLFIGFIYKSFMRNRGLERAKSLTYTSLFAVVPLITLMVAILSIFPSFQDIGSEVQGMIFDRLLPSSSSQIEGYLSDFASQAKKVTWVGAVMFGVTAYLMLVNVERNFNLIWGVSELRKGLSSFLLYWSVLSLGPILLGVGAGVSTYIASLSLFDIFSEVSETVGVNSLLLNLFPLVLTAGAFTLLFFAVPNCGVQFKHGLIGGIVVSLLFMIVKKLFSQAMEVASYELVYGTFAAVPIFLIWIYVCWVIILLGANLVRALPLFSISFENNTSHPTIIMLALLHKFWDKQQRGESLKISELMNENWPFKEVEVEVFLDLLESNKIIRTFDQEEYILIRDLQTISLWNMLQSLPWPTPTIKNLDAQLPSALSAHIKDYPALCSRFKKVEELSEKEFVESLANFFYDKPEK